MTLDLMVKVGGVTFPNPVLLGSGPHGRNLKSITAVAQAGAGGIVTKTISLEPRAGFPHPRTFMDGPSILMNAFGGPNPGLTAFQEIIRSAKKEIKIPLVGSISARSLDEVVKVAKGIAQAGADLLELNFKVLTEMDNPEEFLSTSIQKVKDSVKIPVGAKLAPNRPLEIPHLAEVAQKAGADFLTLINVVPGFSIDIETFRPRLGNPLAAYYSGAAIKPLAVKCIFEAARRVNIPIFGAGGCTCAADAIEMILAGARAVQIVTAAMVKGPSVFPEILTGIVDYLTRKKIAAVEELCGRAHDHLPSLSLQETI